MRAARFYDQRHDDQRASRGWDDRGGWWGGDRDHRDWRTVDRDGHDHDDHHGDHHHHDNNWNWR